MTSTGSMRNSKNRNKVLEYIRVRIDMLCEERTKNDNEVAHMVIDSSVSELCTVLEMIERDG
jgi:hypothetical protein